MSIYANNFDSFAEKGIDHPRCGYKSIMANVQVKYKYYILMQVYILNKSSPEQVYLYFFFCNFWHINSQQCQRLLFIYFLYNFLDIKMVNTQRVYFNILFFFRCMFCIYYIPCICVFCINEHRHNTQDTENYFISGKRIMHLYPDEVIT